MKKYLNDINKTLSDINKTNEQIHFIIKNESKNEKGIIILSINFMSFWFRLFEFYLSGKNNYLKISIFTIGKNNTGSGLFAFKKIKGKPPIVDFIFIGFLSRLYLKYILNIEIINKG